MFKSIPIFCLIVFASVCANAQLKADQRTFDFGLIERGSDRVLERIILNSGEKESTLLRVDVDSREYDIRTDVRKLQPGDTMRVRIKLNPISEGRRNDDLQLLFNNQTLNFDIKADITYVDPADNTPCPDFEKQNTSTTIAWEAYFKVIDRKTKKPIPHAEILLVGKTGISMKYTADRKGELTTSLPIDFYTIKASSSGYAKYSLDSYINKRNKDFILELMPGEMGSVVVLKPGKKDLEEKEHLDIEIVEEAPVEQEPVIEEEDETEFSLGAYKRNNAVFLVDISTSMRKEDRIELLKSSMIELAMMLRPDDVISIVTYATSTDVVLSGEHVSDANRIIDVIESLEAEGKTAGEAGLKQAYRICQKHFIESGNNHVYIATDGAFNKGSEKIKKMVKAKARRDMHLSVLSIRSSKWVDKKMQELADAGRGRHLSLQEEEDQGALKDLVKELSKR